jgi:hypothetical protein
MNKFLNNCFDLELDAKNLGIIKIRTIIKKVAGIN